MKSNYFLSFGTALLILLFFAAGRGYAQISFTLSTSTLCITQPTAAVYASVTGTTMGTTGYSWSITPGNSCGTVVATSAANATLGFSCGGNYTIFCSALDINNNVIVTATAALQAASVLPPTVSISNSSVGCAGSTFSVSYGGAMTYTTYGPNSTAIPGSPVYLTPLASGLYTVVSSHSLGCLYGNTFSLSVHPAVNLNLVATKTVVCLGDSVTLSVSGANSYTWSNSGLSNSTVIYPSTSTLVSVIGLNGATGCTASASQVILVNAPPVINLTSSSFSGCVGQIYTLTASGANTYSWSNGLTGNPVVVSPSTSICFSVIGTNMLGCTNIHTTCINVLQGPALTVIGNTSVCLGTSSTFTASGGTTYLWNGSAGGNTFHILPNASTVVTVSSVGSNGCTGMSTINLNVNSNCSDVWPGDANSDGTVSGTDVLELGLAFNSTGTPRSSGGNTYMAHQATNWTGTVSTGKNLVHADCNGDGTIDNGDTLAIFNNFGLNHSFRPAASSADPEITLVAPALAYAGQWNVADVVVGSPTANISQLYGLTFDLDFDEFSIDDAYLVYTSSFLNAGNQNVQFRKTFISNGKLVGATVRTDHMNVNGNGKLAELHYKLKSDVTDGHILHFDISNAQKVDKDGVLLTMTPGSMSQLATTNLTGLRENAGVVWSAAYPNPASDYVIVRSGSSRDSDFSLTDLSGRIVSSGSFNNEIRLVVSDLQAGVYFLELRDGENSSVQKLVVDHR